MTLDYDFITFGEMNLYCSFPYATFNVWKDNQKISVQHMNIDYAQYRSLSEQNRIEDAKIMTDLKERDHKIEDELNGLEDEKDTPSNNDNTAPELHNIDHTDTK